MTDLLFSKACERNKDPILGVLKEYFPTNPKKILEIGFGSAQHAYYFAENFPDTQWHIADVKDYHPNYNAREKALGRRKNIVGPFLFHSQTQGIDHNLPREKFDAVTLANVLHIMSWQEAMTSLNFFPQLLDEGSLLFLYGPFKFQGQFTSESNENFDRHLKAQNPKMGIRSFEEIQGILSNHAVEFQRRWDLPANNQILVFKKNKTS